MGAFCTNCYGDYIYHLNPRVNYSNGKFEIHDLDCKTFQTRRKLECLKTNNDGQAFCNAEKIIDKLGKDAVPSFCNFCFPDAEKLYG